MATMRLLRLVCNNPEDSTGDDDIYIYVNGKKVWGPEEMDSSPASKKSRSINYSKDFGTHAKFRVELLEEDAYSPGGDDNLGHFDILPTPTSPDQVHRFKGSSHGFSWDYQLYWQVDS